ncbi:hypothetical protein K438DRAFT_1611637 [Mycena galopus ATCC 62051]|nr:hypothetical protein K438DRAFT_1611637 [Mycena galopus ATCC 62051]
MGCNRHHNIHIPSDGPYEEPDAANTVDGQSSPIGPRDPPTYYGPPVGFVDLREEDFGNEDSDNEYGADSRAPKLSDVEKAVSVLNFTGQFNIFSLKDFLNVLFTLESPAITNVTNSYLGRGGAVHLLKVGVMRHWQFDDDSTVKNWIVEKAAAICAQEASFLTDRASRSPYFPAAMTLCVPANSLSVQRLQTFSVLDMLALYDHTTPHIQAILGAVIRKIGPQANSVHSKSRTTHNPDLARTLITSMLLNLRSCEINLHAAINSLLLWSGSVSKQITQTLNHYGLCTSPRYQAAAVQSISRDAVSLAIKVADDPRHLILLPNDNFNWVGKSWEGSACHGDVVHDQVSALLVALPLPAGTSETEVQCLGNAENFARTAGT